MPRARYQSPTASIASASGIPAEPMASALFARPVKPAAARSSQSPSRASSGARQPPAAARSSSEIAIIDQLPASGQRASHYLEQRRLRSGVALARDLLPTPFLKGP